MTAAQGPVAPDLLNGTFGFYMDGLRSFAVQADLNGQPDVANAADVTASTATVPPAVLVPAHDGEPPRFDAGWPPHPRGTGEQWPAESRLSTDTNPGRYPLAYAWADLLSVNQPPAWSWRFRGADRQLEPAAAIATATRAAQEAYLQMGSLHRPVLVVPNHLTGRLQQALLEAHDRLGCPARLLWRPVAAAMAWSKAMAAAFSPGPEMASAGELAVLHLGLDEWEFTSLDMVWTSDGRLVPARRRPGKGGVIPSFGWAALHHTLSKLIESRGRRDQIGDWLGIWSTLWATPWAAQLLDGLSRSTLDDSHAAKEAVDAWTKELMAAFAGRAVVADVSGRLPRWHGQSGHEAWLTAARSSIRDHKLIGVVVTGPMAAMRAAGRTVMGETQAARIAPAFASRALIEGRDLSAGCMAAAAAQYAAAAAGGRVAYYDTLPKIHTVISRDGELAWEPLLQEDDQYVEGGKLWTRDPNLSGLVLRPNTAELVIVMDHEEHDSVREVTAVLGDLQLQRPEPMSLNVAIEPAAGEARIEVVPERSALFGRKRIFVEWGTMRPTGLNRRQWADQQARVCPPPRPRQSSVKMWRAARDEIAAFVGVASVSPQLLASRLPRLKELLRSRDTAYPGELCTAISSDGRPGHGFEADERLVKDVLNRLLPLIEVQRSSVPSWWQDLLHVLAGTGSADVRLQRYLFDRLRRQQSIRVPILDDSELAALGSCLHDPRAIGMFGGIVRNRFVASVEGVNNWLKSYSEVLRYRRDACRHTDSAVCQRISEHALAIFEQQRQRHNMTYLFRNSALVIVYLLRRRAYDDDYLQPDSPLALATKRAFAEAIDDVRSRRTTPLGGAVDIPASLQQMIDYIDRRGRGDLLFGVD